MKARNNWRSRTKQWDKLAIRVRLGAIDFLSIEVDVSRSFYMLTILNLTIKNR
jgi:hypothetical protein